MVFWGIPLWLKLAVALVAVFRHLVTGPRALSQSHPNVMKSQRVWGSLLMNAQSPIIVIEVTCAEFACFLFQIVLATFGIPNEQLF